MRSAVSRGSGEIRDSYPEGDNRGRRDREMRLARTETRKDRPDYRLRRRRTAYQAVIGTHAIGVVQQRPLEEVLIAERVCYAGDWEYAPGKL